MKRLAVTAFLALAACGAQPGDSAASSPDLETAAIQRGLLPDPVSADPVGLYARDTDRLCIVEGKGGYRVGLTTDFGEGIACNGSAIGALSGDRVTLKFSEECQVEAAFRGDRITLPGKVPDGCKTLCRGRASLAGVDVSRLSNSGSEARAMRGANGKLLCAGD